jgi:hypothetical protein
MQQLKVQTGCDFQEVWHAGTKKLTFLKKEYALPLKKARPASAYANATPNAFDAITNTHLMRMFLNFLAVRRLGRKSQCYLLNANRFFCERRE